MHRDAPYPSSGWHSDGLLEYTRQPFKRSLESKFASKVHAVGGEQESIMMVQQGAQPLPYMHIFQDRFRPILGSEVAGVVDESEE